MLKTTIYLDNAATTKVSDNVLNAMLPYLKEEYGNPSSIYTLGRNSAIAVNKARHQVAQALGAETERVFFTSGITQFCTHWTRSRKRALR